MGSTAVLPLHLQTAPGSVNVPIAQLPHQPGLKVESEQQVAKSFVDKFNAALEQKSPAALAELFANESYWRDHLALSWDFETASGKDEIQSLIQKASRAKGGLGLTNIALDQSNPVGAPRATPLNPEGTANCLQFFITFQTAVGSGKGVLRLVPETDSWKIFTLYTVLQDITGHEEATGKRRPTGVQHGADPNRKNWVERRRDEQEWADGAEPAVIILGAGQAGLTIAARLKALGVPTLIIEQNGRVGDSWRNRYRQLVLHDPIWFDHLPYVPFPATWPIYTPKDKMADFLEAYVGLLDLNVWTESTLVESEYHDAKGVWDVKVERRSKDGTPEVRVFHPRHVIQATGHSGKKSVPNFKGANDFKGALLCHSSEFKGAQHGKQGTKAVIVGSCNSAHDIAQDYYEKGYDVTIVQRSSTCVVSSKSVLEISCKGLFDEDGPPTDDADFIAHSFPVPVFKAIQVSMTKLQLEMDKELLAGLESSGFKLDKGPDDAGLFLKYWQRGGGYYIDVGASGLIASGKIKVKQGQEIAEVLPNGLRFADGTELEADEIVLATGYQNMTTQTRAIFGDKVADRVKEVWGYDKTKEMRGIWRGSGHPGFWLHGGNLAFCRYFSRLLALQIKAVELGLNKYGSD